MALAGGVDAVQLRERDMRARALYDLALKLRAITREAGAALIVTGCGEVRLRIARFAARVPLETEAAGWTKIMAEAATVIATIVA